MRPGRRIGPWVVHGALAASAALLAYLVWRSLHWPLIHDAALMHYIAWLISTGSVPYRDTFDSNMPGVYLIHMAVLGLGGTGDAAFRVFDLGWLAVTAWIMFVYCRAAGNRVGGAAAVTLFALQHVSGGANLAGQRDFLLCVFLVAGAYGVARSAESGGRIAPLAWAGLALGSATMIKPFAGLFLVGCAGAAAMSARRASRSSLGAAGAVLGAGLVVPALLFGWLASIGGLAPLFRITTEWALPFYGRLGGAGPLWHLVSLRWTFLGAAALLGAVRRAPGPYDIRRRLAIVGVVYAFLHYALQSKGYSYHLYPLACFLCLLAGLGLAPDSPGTPGLAARVRAYAGGLPAALAVALTLIVMGERGLAWANEPGNAKLGERVEAVIFDLKKLLPGLPQDGTVQVLGPPGGHVLLKMRLRQPTRFFTDFQFFLPTRDPRIEALRTEFVTGLEARPPAAIVVFPGRGPAGPYGRLAEFPVLVEIINYRYFLAEDGKGYQIYLKNPR